MQCCTYFAPFTLNCTQKILIVLLIPFHPLYIVWFFFIISLVVALLVHLKYKVLDIMAGVFSPASKKVSGLASYNILILHTRFFVLQDCTFDKPHEPYVDNYNNNFSCTVVILYYWHTTSNEQ
ncbi:hypothetical protein ACJX0J_024469 [Zea mays]